MVRSAGFLMVALTSAISSACDRGPIEISKPPELALPHAVFSSASGAGKETISGTIEFVGVLPPARLDQTKSGRCHYFDSPELTQFTGDVSGAVTFYEQLEVPCGFSDIVASAPFGGEVTWHGRTGIISGQWATNCITDASVPPLGLSCAGKMNARGTGELEGVQFHFTWGPGWFPFPYTGTAITGGNG